MSDPERATGDRSQRYRNWMRPETRVGYDYAHAIVDDHRGWPMLSCSKTKGRDCTALVERALSSFSEHGITTRRLMTVRPVTAVDRRNRARLKTA